MVKTKDTGEQDAVIIPAEEVKEYKDRYSSDEDKFWYELILAL